MKKFENANIQRKRCVFFISKPPLFCEYSSNNFLNSDFKSEKMLKQLFQKNLRGIACECSKNETQTLFQNQDFEKRKNLFKKKLLHGYSKIHELKLVTIGLASPKKIQSWAEKELPNGKTFGEVTNANTFHYRTFKPSKGGLFCERIFGPIKDFECACGKRQKPTALESKKILEHEQTTRYFCPNCDVEYTWSIIRRYQLGYIKLNAPVAHLWYFKTNPSYLSILFDMKRKNLESIIYCNETITIENMWRFSEQNSNLNRSPSDLYSTWQKMFKIEENIKKYQIFYETEKQKFKQKKISFRSLYSDKKIQNQQINWLEFERNEKIQNFQSALENKSLKDSSLLTNILSKEKSSVLRNLSNQKQKKFMLFFVQQTWKIFLKKIYKDTIFMNISQQFISENFFEKFTQVFSVFLLCSKKNSKFLDSNNLLNFEKFNIGTKTKNSFEKNTEIFSFAPVENNQEILLKKKTKNKKLWKSFVFLLKFGISLNDQRIKQLESLNSLSKKDFIFLLNLIPFLKQISLVQNLTFQRKKKSTCHSLLLQNLLKKKKMQKSWNLKNQNLSKQKKKIDIQTNLKKLNSVLFELNIPGSSVFTKQKRESLPQIESAFVFNKKNERLPLEKFFVHLKTNPKFSLSFQAQLLNQSVHVQKILCFLKSFYEIDFCFFLQNHYEKMRPTFISSKNFQNEEFRECIELFFQQSTISSLFEKIAFEYFSSYFFFSEAGLLSSFHLGFFDAKNSKVEPFLLKKKKNTNLNSLSFDSIVFQSEKDQKYFFDVNHFSVFVLKFFPFFIFDFAFFKPEMVGKENFLQIFENTRFQKDQNQKHFHQKFQEKFEIEILNKSLNSRTKLSERKKEIQYEQFQKFFNFDMVDLNFKRKFSSTKNFRTQTASKSFHLDFFTKFNQIEKKKASTFQNKKTLSSNFALCHIQKKYKLRDQNNFLKNQISTIAYNYTWVNDSDWKYFVYYNSFFFYEFEDIPISFYRSASPLKTKRKTNPFVFSDENSSNTGFGQSLASFLSWSIESSQKNFFVGAGILEKLLTEYTSNELRKMTKQHQILLPKINQTIRIFKQIAKTKKDSLKIQKYIQKREHIIRRLKFLRKFSRRNSNPSFLILKNLPVLPPDLRPILKLQNQIAASDLNRFYQRIIYRNDRLKKFSKDSVTNQSFEMKYAQRLLQEAVDNLIQNGKGSVKAETNSRGQPLKSLSEILKGKQGRFRQYLLGKRVDYSGRSVIVVGPELKLYECGLPKEMALELFLPFLIQHILQYKLAQTVIGAKNLLKSDSTLTLHLLHKVMKNIPILLNRAPTLHRLGFQAFLPKLIEGRAILLHPMVCPAFNADFDGDQMAVHIPLTVEARTEAWKFMLSINNLINSATGEPIILPSQDMVLGCYYLTIDFSSKFGAIQVSDSLKKQNFQNFQNFMNQKKSFLFFKNFTNVLTAYQSKEISLHTPVWVKWNASVDFGNDFSKPVEIRLQKNGSWQQILPKYTTFYNQSNQQLSRFIRTTTGRILMNLMIQQCINEKSSNF
nr:RNA polymerase II large subunit Rpb1 [Scenedesmaceae sp. YH-2023b]